MESTVMTTTGSRNAQKKTHFDTVSAARKFMHNIIAHNDDECGTATLYVGGDYRCCRVISRKPRN